MKKSTAEEKNVIYSSSKTSKRKALKKITAILLAIFIIVFLIYSGIRMYNECMFEGKDDGSSVTAELNWSVTTDSSIFTTENNSEIDMSLKDILSTIPDCILKYDKKKNLVQIEFDKSCTVKWSDEKKTRTFYQIGKYYIADLSVDNTTTIN